MRRTLYLSSVPASSSLHQLRSHLTFDFGRGKRLPHAIPSSRASSLFLRGIAWRKGRRERRPFSSPRKLYLVKKREAWLGRNSNLFSGGPSLGPFRRMLRSAATRWREGPIFSLATSLAHNKSRRGRRVLLQAVRRQPVGWW